MAQTRAAVQLNEERANGRMRIILPLLISIVLALASAGALWLWWRSPIPTFMIFTPILHGMLLGVGLMWLVTRFGVRCRVRRTVIGLLAGLVSVAALVLGQYVSSAYDYQRDTQSAIETKMPGFTRATRSDILGDYDRNVLEPVTGHSGVVGHLLLQDRRDPWRGWLRCFEAIIVIGIATALCVAAPALDPNALSQSPGS